MDAADSAADWRAQPHAIVERDGVRYTLLGTAHVSRASVDAVRAAIAEGGFDEIAVELDEQRLAAISDPASLASLDLIQVLREGKVPLFAANLALASYQRRLAEQLGIEPGAELKAAVDDARAAGLPVRLIDRNVGLTFRRAQQSLGWWQRARLGAGILAGLIVDEDVAEHDIEKLKQGDMLASSFSEFAEQTPELYQALIAERDRYMAARLRHEPGPARKVLAVVGAGHLEGLARHLGEDQAAPTEVTAALEAVRPKSKVPWMEIGIGVFLLAGFAWGFAAGGLEVGADLLLYWILWTGGLGALGCLVAGGHPLSILGAFLSSPFTPLHPALASGTVSAAIEAWVRKPTYADFMALREDVNTVRGWWRNRVARVLVNFFLTSLGTVVGVWTGGAKMLARLFG